MRGKCDDPGSDAQPRPKGWAGVSRHRQAPRKEVPAEGTGQRLRGRSRTSLRNREECGPAEKGGRKGPEMHKGLIVWARESCVPHESAVTGVFSRGARLIGTMGRSLW